LPETVDGIRVGRRNLIFQGGSADEGREAFAGLAQDRLFFGKTPPGSSLLRFGKRRPASAESGEFSRRTRGLRMNGEHGLEQAVLL